MTPEGKVKLAIKKLLNSYPDVYYHFPVPCGYGEQTLDCIGCFQGEFFAIEAKALGKKPTKRQQRTIAAMEMAGGTTFVIDGPKGLVILKTWLDGRATDPTDDFEVFQDGRAYQ